MDDYHLDLQEEGNSYRHYLNGQKVHPGDTLELQIDGNWMPGRYEWCFMPNVNPYLVLDADKDDSISLSQRSMLRWPRR